MHKFTRDAEKAVGMVTNLSSSFFF